MNDQPPVQLEIDRGVARLWLNRPHSRNALNRDLLETFEAHVDQLERNRDVTVAVLAGRGHGFCAGADLHEVQRCSAAEAQQLERRCAAILERWAALPIPRIASVHGFAVGGGFSLLLYCDLRIVAHHTRLGFPPIARHWLIPWGLSRLAAWVGTARAEQLLLTAGLFTTDEGLRLGLVDRAVEPAELASVTDQVARSLADSRREVVAEVRTFFAQLRGADHAHWDEVASAGFERCFQTAPTQAMLRAFVERREGRASARDTSEDDTTKPRNTTDEENHEA